MTACGTSNSSAPKAGEATPQTDFHSYINAQWLKNTKLGAGESQIDNLSQLSEKTQEAIQEMIDQLDMDYSKLQAGSDEKNLLIFTDWQPILILATNWG